jgi:DNA-binding response OmpR family regulator
MDLMMPVMDGFKLLEELKKTDIKIPVIISTNLSQEEDKKRVMDLGATDYFVKSDIPINEVIERVKQALGILN